MPFNIRKFLCNSSRSNCSSIDAEATTFSIDTMGFVSLFNLVFLISNLKESIKIPWDDLDYGFVRQML